MLHFKHLIQIFSINFFKKIIARSRSYTSYTCYTCDHNMYSSFELWSYKWVTSYWRKPLTFQAKSCAVKGPLHQDFFLSERVCYPSFCPVTHKNIAESSQISNTQNAWGFFWQEWLYAHPPGCCDILKKMTMPQDAFEGNPSVGISPRPAGNRISTIKVRTASHSFHFFTWIVKTVWSRCSFCLI